MTHAPSIMVQVPMGLPGLEARMLLGFSEGVVGGRLRPSRRPGGSSESSNSGDGGDCGGGADAGDGAAADDDDNDDDDNSGGFGSRLAVLVAAACTNPAKLYGLYPTKGCVAVGSDADLVLWDASATATITSSGASGGDLASGLGDSGGGGEDGGGGSLWRLHDDLDYSPYVAADRSFSLRQSGRGVSLCAARR